MPFEMLFSIVSNLKYLGAAMLISVLLIMIFYGLLIFNRWQIKLIKQGQDKAERQMRIDKVNERRRLRKIEKERQET